MYKCSWSFGEQYVSNPQQSSQGPGIRVLQSHWGSITKRSRALLSGRSSITDRQPQQYPLYLWAPFPSLVPLPWQLKASWHSLYSEQRLLHPDRQKQRSATVVTMERFGNQKCYSELKLVTKRQHKYYAVLRPHISNPGVTHITTFKKKHTHTLQKSQWESNSESHHKWMNFLLLKTQ